MTRLSLLTILFFIFLSSCSEKSEEKPASAEKPEDNRFTPVVMTAEGALDEPMMFQVAGDGMIYIIERKGGFKKFDPSLNKMTLIKTFDVFDGNEQGLIGMTLDPSFLQNHRVYFQYAPKNEKIFRLVRYELASDSLIDSSAKVLLEIPVDRDHTSHTGGGMAWDKNGNLYLTVGNNTGNRLTAQTDERPGFSYLDDQRGASNTNDLRGKILRIHPEDDGSYTIPKGNLFPVGTEKTRPEIYTMGHRNVWRVSVDSKTGWIFWGEIGPDQDMDSPTGPRGYDEQNMAKAPGFFGWPYFIADNQAIPKFDFVNNRVGEKLDAAKPLNTSPNNTGLRELPPAQPALIYYPYAASEKFPLVGSSSRCAIGGPVFRKSDFAKAERIFPSYYEGKWLMADYSRFWIMAVTLDEDGNYKSMERFAPGYHPVQPLDIKFGPSGDLYVLEYGSNTVRSATESRLVRIEYNSGNRKPVAKATASKKGGAVPFTTTLSAKGSIDYDKDELTYQWSVEAEGKATKTIKGEIATITLEEPGVYTAKLIATDNKGESNAATVKLIAGNEPPVVDVTFEGNKTFFFPGESVRYSVKVSDNEDGDLNKGVRPDQVAVSMDYASEGFDYAPVTMGHAALDFSTRFAIARTLVNNSDCRTCHTVDVKAFGPAFRQIAERYKNKRGATDSLAKRIVRGSSGLWGNDNNMPAHPSISMNDARLISQYILNIDSETRSTLPLTGKVTTQPPADDNGRGTYFFRAAYTDRGATSHTTDTILVFGSPKVNPLKADIIEGGALRDQLDEYIFLTVKPESYIAFRGVDLTGVKEISFRPNWHLYDIYPGGTIEVRVGRPDGQLIGQTTMEPEQFNTRYRGLFDGLPNPDEDQQRRSKVYPPLDPSKFFARGSDKNSFTIPSVAQIAQIGGVHDVYFIFRNDKVKKSESIFPLSQIEFSNKTSGK
jgi:cytochrome c